MARQPILVVDDDADNRAVIKFALRDKGYPVVLASNGAEALHMLAHCRPGCLLLDMRMPVLDGWGVARALQERGIVLPTVIITAATDGQEWAEEVRAAAYLAKPFDIDELLDTIDQVCPA